MIVLSDKLSTESFHAFIDEQLSDEQYLQVEAQLDEIPDKLEEIQQCHIINERLREVFDPIVEEDVPEDLYSLALYGINSEYHDDTQDFQQFGYEFDEARNAVTGFNGEIATPLDSFDAALELQDENFIDTNEIDANEFAELEALSAGDDKDLTDFDIDNIHNSTGNILPDIFGDDTKSAYGSSTYPLRAAEDQAILDDIGSLTLEPLEKDDQSAVASNYSSPLEQPHLDNLPELSTEDRADAQSMAPEFELEPIERTITSASFDVPELQFEHASVVPDRQAAERNYLQKQQRVLDTLEASEELSLEPLEMEDGAAAIRKSKFIEPMGTISTKANVPVDTAEMPGSPDASREFDNKVTPAQSDDDQFAPQRNQEGLFTGFASDETKGNTKQGPGIVSNAAQTMAKANTKDRLIKTAAGITDTPEYSVNEIMESLDEIPDSGEQAPQDVVAEFFAANKAESDFEVNDVVKEFEEVSDQFNDHYDQNTFGSPVAQIRQKADAIFSGINYKFSALKNSFVRKEQESIQDFNKAPSSIRINISEPPEERIVSTTFGAGAGVDETSGPEGLSRKIGDTLKMYKQKLAHLTVTENTEPADNREPRQFDAASQVKNYKQIATHALERMSPENRMTIGGAILLVIGLMVGGSIASLFEQPVNAISTDKVEQLAIDAHILYTQQSQNFAGNPSASITESMQWLSARIGRQIRLADVQLEGFKHQRAIVIPTMVSYAIANIFENKSNQSITLFVASTVDPVANSPLTCRVPAGIDGLCSWVKDSVQYVAVANLSLSRVRTFSETLMGNL
ncbi:MAG: hypothetical protein L0Z73_02100 [Gammaproteobacteria bacterium]|nr:hypothetical protein [Gammaproteobacteria bacterium]